MKNNGKRVNVRLLAILLSLACTAIFTCSAIAAMFANEMDVYNTQKQQVLEICNKRVDKIYATKAMAKRGTSTGNQLENTGFRYGIIKTEKPELVDFSKPSNYIEQNFDTMPPAKMEQITGQWKVLGYRVYDDTYYYWQESVLGQAGYHSNILGRQEINQNILEGFQNITSEEKEQIEWKEFRQVQIEDYVYDIEKGMFFYKTAEGYFRAHTIQVPIATDGGMLQLTYDHSQKAYYNSYKDDCVIPKYYLTFNELDGSQFDWKSWNSIVLDGRVLQHLEIDYVQQVPEQEISTQFYSEVTENTLSYWVTTEGNSSANTSYYVIYQTVESPKAIFPWNGDLYGQVKDLVDYLYLIRYPAIVLMIFSVVGWIVAAIVLLRTTDQAKNPAGHKMPLDLFYLFMGMACLAVFIPALYLLTESTDFWLMNLTALFFLLLDGLLLWTICETASRVRMGKWWENTVLIKLLRLIGRLLKRTILFVGDHLSILWKVVTIIGIITLVELIMIVAFDINCSVVFLGLWVLWKVFLGIIMVLVWKPLSRLKEAGERMAAGEIYEKVDTSHMIGELKSYGDSLNQIGDGLQRALEERMKSERFKTELITNVSHDIKTPLTSIINYIDLLGKDDTVSQESKKYLEVLNRQSDRLKKLIEDLIEASKASTGNLPVNNSPIEMGVMLIQILGEYEEKSRQNQVDLVLTKPDEEISVVTDPRHLSRVLDNLIQNICKYTYPGTRAFIDLEKTDRGCRIILRNTSKFPLNITGDELMERFVRGDVSRHTEGSGLGLSIAQSLMELMQGALTISVEGDMFRAILEITSQAEG